jgi:hypothetical protein
VYNVTLRQIVLLLLTWEIKKKVTYSECVFVALGIQYAMHMCHIVLVAYPAVQYFSHIS